MKQLKAEWQYIGLDSYKQKEVKETVDHILTQHNAFVDYVGERFNKPDWTQIKVETKAYPAETAKINPKTITLPKPDWWPYANPDRQRGYEDALEHASKALGVIINLED